MWWIWRSFPDRDDDFRVTEIPQAMRENDLSFNLGIEVAQPIPLIEVPVQDNDSGHITDNLIGFPRGLVVSIKLRQALLQAGADNIQWFPSVAVLTGRGARMADYAVANIIGRISGVDLGASDLVIDQDDGSIDFINRLVLKSDIPDTLPAFRLIEFLPIVVVNDRIKKSVVDAGCTGVQFITPEQLVL